MLIYNNFQKITNKPTVYVNTLSVEKQLKFIMETFNDGFLKFWNKVNLKVKNSNIHSQKEYMDFLTLKRAFVKYRTLALTCEEILHMRVSINGHFKVPKNKRIYKMCYRTFYSLKKIYIKFIDKLSVNFLNLKEKSKRPMKITEVYSSY